MNSLRIAFAGTPEFALPALRALLDSRHRVVGVLTQPDRPAGRGLGLRASAVKLLASATQPALPLAQPATLKTPEGRAALEAWAPDLLVVVAYGLILPPAVLALPRLGCLNIHGSLLPRWRGAAPIQRALLAGDAETGVTIMQLDAGLDTGPILLERRRPIGRHETAGDLHDALAELGAVALLEAIDGITSGALVPRAQPGDGASYAPKIEKAEAKLDWAAHVDDLDRRIRAFHPWPIAETSFAGESLKLLRASVVDPGAREAAPGTVLGLADDGLRVACGMGVLAVRELQRPGKRPTSARDFANAVRLTGLRFGA
jgi:methionyl-tRNA formyltransferase